MKKIVNLVTEKLKKKNVTEINRNFRRTHVFWPLLLYRLPSFQRPTIVGFPGSCSPFKLDFYQVNLIKTETSDRRKPLYDHDKLKLRNENDDLRRRIVNTSGSVANHMTFW